MSYDFFGKVVVIGQFWISSLDELPGVCILLHHLNDTVPVIGIDATQGLTPKMGILMQRQLGIDLTEVKVHLSPIGEAVALTGSGLHMAYLAGLALVLLGILQDSAVLAVISANRDTHSLQMVNHSTTSLTVLSRQAAGLDNLFLISRLYIGNPLRTDITLQKRNIIGYGRSGDKTDNSVDDILFQNGSEDFLLAFLQLIGIATEEYSAVCTLDIAAGTEIALIASRRLIEATHGNIIEDKRLGQGITILILEDALLFLPDGRSFTEGSHGITEIRHGGLGKILGNLFHFSIGEELVQAIGKHSHVIGTGTEIVLVGNNWVKSLFLGESKGRLDGLGGIVEHTTDLELVVNSKVRLGKLVEDVTTGTEELECTKGRLVSSVVGLHPGLHKLALQSLLYLLSRHFPGNDIRQNSGILLLSILLDIMGNSLLRLTVELDDRVDEAEIAVIVLDAVVTPHVSEGHIAVSEPEAVTGEMEAAFGEPCFYLIFSRLLIRINKRLLKDKPDTAAHWVLTDSKEAVCSIAEEMIVDMMLIESGSGIVILQGNIGEGILELDNTAVLLVKENNTFSTWFS